MLALFTVLTVGIAPSPPKADDAAAVYAELGLPTPAGRLPLLSAAYRPDALSAEAVRKDADRYPVRAAVLQAVDALGKVRKLTGKLELHETEVSDAGKARLVKLQEDIAAAILFLDEASTALAGTAGKRSAEPSKRWRVHHAYLSAAVALQTAHLEELNLAYGSVRAGRLPELDKAAGQTGWRLTPADKMASKPAVRKQDEAARELLRNVIADHPDTPWAALAEADLKAKPGLQWQGAVVKLPVSPKRKK